MTPKVSIIIPTHKRRRELLERAINSALHQDYKNIEVVVVDDNSEPDLISYRESTIKLINEIKAKDSRVVLVLNYVNLGGALSRNVGVANSTGEYISFLDDDDEYLPKKVSHQIEFMLEQKVNVSFTDLSIYNEKDKLIDRRNRRELKSMDKDYLLKYHIIKNLTGTETYMIKKDIFLKVKGFDNVKVGHEFYLIHKLLKLPESSFAYYPFDDIKAYRTAEESISNGPNKIKGERDNYKFKKQFFNLLTLSERRYLKCRYRAVLAISYRRRKNLIGFLFYLLLAFLTDPFISIREALKLKK
jgi:glycosyltransferase involved in cell wall biosynthesis